MSQSKVSNLNIKMHGNRVVQMAFKGKYTRDQIKKIVQEKSNEFKRRNEIQGQIMVSLKYPMGWRSGYFSDFGDNVLLYDHSDSDSTLEEPKHFEEFRIYVMKTGSKKGGCSSRYDITNDCLYDCLKEIIPLDLPWSTPESFKEYLDLERNEKVSIDDMENIEKHLIKYSISVSGDHTYTSTKKSNHIIQLKLLDGHYTLKNDYLVQKGISNQEKEPMIYKNIKDNTEIQVFRNNKLTKITKEDYKEIRSKPRSSKYILIPCDDNKTLEETYEDFIENADLLKKETKGIVNLYKTGMNRKTALDLFYKMNRCINPDPIEQDEAIWIQNASYSAMCWADKYEGKAYKYDVCSMYPSIMLDHQMLFPIKRGTFIKMKQNEFDSLKFFMYGIYRSRINKSEDELKNKLFRFNKKNYYTHIDLTRAKDIGLEIELIRDKQPNILHYPRDILIQGDKLFGSYVNLLFKLKEKKIPIAKKLLNILWGALSQKNVIDVIVDEKSNEVKEIREDRTVIGFIPLNDTKTRVQIVKNDYYYETDYARIAPFLLAKGRFLITKIMKPHIENIKRVHTDGIISDTKLDFDSNELGEMKYEGYSKNCKIHNNIRIEGKFRI